jgi:structural maintenance of chromosome 2
VLVAFDTELADLEKDIRKKKQDISDAELAVKKLEHELGVGVKEKTGAEALREGLERQFAWIKEDSG